MAPERDDQDVLERVDGKPVNRTFHGLMASSWGHARLELFPDRVVETSKFVVAESESVLPLSKVQAVEYVVRGNPLWLALGIPFIVILVGFLFILFYFLFKKRFLIIHGIGFQQAINFKGNPDKYLEFMDHVLSQARKAEKAALGKSPSPPVSVSEPAVARDRPASGAGSLVCHSCGTEFRLPPGSAGKRFRCTSCKAVLEAPA